VYVSERQRNPFVRSARGGRVLSALMLPWFTVRPPRGFGVLTTTGRRTGKTRRKCVRAIRRGNQVYIVSIRPTAWLANIRAEPNVRLRIPGGTFSGVARELREPLKTQEAKAAYCGTVVPVDYPECSMHRRGRPTRPNIEELLGTWFDEGIPLVVELAD
jgi:deazaflavin-dependent oxidoreductase (nitroreductase family)